MLKVPAGPLDARRHAVKSNARRELREKPDLVAAHWSLAALKVFASPRYSDERMWLYPASALGEVPRRVLGGYIEPVRVPLVGLDRRIEGYREIGLRQNPGAT